jgi:hypothetical protein
MEITNALGPINGENAHGLEKLKMLKFLTGSSLMNGNFFLISNLKRIKKYLTPPFKN